MIEITGDHSGWLWIGKHTRFVHGVFDDLRSCGGVRAGKSTFENLPAAPEMSNFTVTFTPKSITPDGPFRYLHAQPDHRNSVQRDIPDEIEFGQDGFTLHSSSCISHLFANAFAKYNRYYLLVS